MATSYPEIRIKNAWLLRQNASAHLHELWATKDDDPLETNEQVDDIVKSYQDAWKPYEQKVLAAMCDELGLTFRQNIIDVNIAPWFHAFSDPMVIGTSYTPERFAEILTHELIHRLLTDNNETPYGTKYLYHWMELFGKDHETVTLAHIPVHATLKAIFDDHLHEPQRTMSEREQHRKWPIYDAAWKYIEANDYREIIQKLRAQYKELETTTHGK